jgi:hypothetical protein
MKMIRHDGQSEQVDPERPGQSLSMVFLKNGTQILKLLFFCSEDCVTTKPSVNLD